MTTQSAIDPSSSARPKPSFGFRLSVDAWAVTLALVLSLLVWAGWIKQVPW